MSTPSRLPSVRKPPGAAAFSRPVSAIEGVSGPVTSGAGSTARSAKRRSLLPQFSRKVSGEDKPGEHIKEEGESDDDERGKEAARDAALRALEAPDERPDMDRRAMLPPASKMARPTSMRRPPAGLNAKTGHSAPKTIGASRDGKHTESKIGAYGTATSKLASASSAIRRTGTIKAASDSVRAAGTTHVANAQPKSHEHTASMTTATASTADKRSSRSLRPQSVTSRTIYTASDDASTPPASPSKSAHPNRRSQMLPPPKPNFNTYQQHYSPAKSALPKPPLPPSKASRSQSVSTDEATPSDVVEQQIELLQLSLLHQASTQVTLEYEESAYYRLGKKHARLCKEYAGIRDVEIQQRKIQNLDALDTWCPDANLLAESLQTLSRVHGELYSLSEPESRYNDLVLTFSEWIGRSDARFEAFIAPLPDDWNATQASLGLKLRALRRSLQSLPPLPPVARGSSLDALVENSVRLVDGMLKELDVMAELEKQVLGQERMRLNDEVQSLVLDTSIAHEKWLPAWERAG